MLLLRLPDRDLRRLLLLVVLLVVVQVADIVSCVLAVSTRRGRRRRGTVVGGFRRPTGSSIGVVSVGVSVLEASARTNGRLGRGVQALRGGTPATTGDSGITGIIGGSAEPRPHGQSGRGWGCCDGLVVAQMVLAGLVHFGKVY